MSKSKFPEPENPMVDQAVDKEAVSALVKPQTPAQPKPAVSAAKPEKQPALVYVGPNLGAPLYLKRNQAFLGGALPNHLRQEFDADADFKALFVRSHDLAKAQADLKRPTSRLAKAWAALDRRRTHQKTEG